MSKLKFYSILMAVILIFAVISFGGCGGSSSHFSSEQVPDEQKPDEQKPDEQDSDDEMPSVLGGFGSPEFNYVSEQLEKEFAEKGLTVPEMHAVIIIPGEMALLPESVDQASGDFMSSTLRGAIKLNPVKGATTLPKKELDRIGKVLKPYYESGDVILMFFPTPETINDLYVGLGEAPMYLETDELLALDENTPSGDLYPEIYAIAKRYNGNSAHQFSYLVPGNFPMMLETLVEMLSDDVSQDISEEGSEELSELEDEIANYIDDGSISDEYKGFRGAYIFQARRYANLLRWAANINVKMEEMKKFAAANVPSVGTADAKDDVLTGAMLSYYAQNITKDFSYYEPDAPWPYVGKRSASYEAGVDDSVIAYHNYGDHNDYYLVRTSFYVKPDFSKFSKDDAIYTVGSIAYYNCARGIEGAAYNIFKNMPKNVNRQSTVTDNISHSTQDSITYNTTVTGGTQSGSPLGTGSFSIGGSETNTTSYSHTKSWSKNDWSIINNCNHTTADWKIDFYDDTHDPQSEKKTTVNAYYADWDTGDVSTGAKNRVDLETDFLFMVTEQFKTPTMWIKPGITIRVTKCNKKHRYCGYYILDYSSPYRVKLVPPPQMLITEGDTLNVDKNGKDNVVFKFLCEGGWMIDSDADWCYISDSDEQFTGGSTGNREKSIFLFVDPYDTGSDKGAHTREATVTVYSLETGETMEVHVTQSNR